MRRTFLGVVAVFVSVGGLRADDRPLPKGYPPTTARASLDGGTVTVRIPVIGYEVKKAEGGGGTLVPVAKENVVRLDLKEIEAFDTRGRKVDAEALRDRLKAEEPVLVSHEGAADPYYLGVVKEGTLVLVVPKGTISATRSSTSSRSRRTPRATAGTGCTRRSRWSAWPTARSSSAGWRNTGTGRRTRRRPARRSGPRSRTSCN